MNELIKIETRDGMPTTNARELHAVLESKSQFADWITRRIEQYDFIENEDYFSFSEISEKPQGGRPKTEYFLTLTMAKELAMVENNEKGKQVRRWIIRKLDRLDAQREMEYWKFRSLINSRDVARALGVSTKTIQRWTNDGRLSYLLLNNIRRYKSEDILKFMEQNYFQAKDGQLLLPLE